VFGNDLIQQAKSESSVIPNVVLICVREVESRGKKKKKKKKRTKKYLFLVINVHFIIQVYWLKAFIENQVPLV
jgi:hypothetical protein